MRFVHSSRARLAILGGALLAAGAAAGADYRLHPGDIVEMSVAGTPQLGLRAPLQLDGTLTFPLVGTIEAADATIAAVRDRIQTVLASKVLRLHANDGREYLRAVEREDIAVSIVEYRPVAIGGDVARPGEVPFRPQMTVRQAIASAGGTLPLLAAAAGPTFDVSGLRSDYVTAWLAIAAQHVRIWRLEGELEGEAPFDANAIPPSPSAEADLDALLAFETAYRETERAEFSAQQEHLKRSIAQADEHIVVLTEQQKNEEVGVAVDTAELARSGDLLTQGTVVHGRVTDARRALLMSSTRLLQTRSQLMQVRRNREELTRDLQRLAGERRLDFLRQLQEATVKLASDRERLHSIEQKLQLAGIQVPSGAQPAAEPTVVLYRQQASASTVRLEADLDSALEPGDFVQISLAAAGAPVPGQATPASASLMARPAGLRMASP